MARIHQLFLSAALAIIMGGTACSAINAGLLRSLPRHVGNQLARRPGLRDAGKLVLRASSSSRAAAKEWGKKAAASTTTLAKEFGTSTVTLTRSFPEAYMRTMQTRPLLVCGFLEGLRHLVGDVIAQHFEHKAAGPQAQAPAGLELERLTVLTAWGAWYGSTLGYQSYHTVYPKLFGVVGTRAAIATTVMDLFFTCPFIYYPVWHMFKEFTDRVIARQGPPLLSSMSASEKVAATCEYGRDLSLQAWNNYKDNFVKDTAAMAIVWIPLHMVNFRFIPLVHRFPFVATTGIIWTTVFSFLQFGDVAPSAEPKAA